MATFVVSDPQRFPTGTTVGAYPRLTDTFTRFAPPVSEAKVDKSGEAKLTGLHEDAPYWYAGEVDGEWRAVAFTPLNDRFTSGLEPTERHSTINTVLQISAERQARADLHAEHIGLASAAPGRDTGHVVITGARSSKDRKKLVTDPEPQPFANQQDVEGVPQRSDTPFGEAHPKDPDEVVPRPSQDQVRKGAPQRSDTEVGEATPKDVREEEPALDQDDVTGRQRSDTPEGEAEPKPKGDLTGEVEGSAAKAEGQTPAKPRAKTTPGKPRTTLKKTKKDQR